MTRRKGFSLIELMVAMAVLSVLLTMSLLILRSMSDSSKKVSGNDSAALQLKKAQRMLETDLIQGKFTFSNVTQVPASLTPGASDGNALWFLSPVDPASKQVVDTSGTPFWQRNVLYYLVVPRGDGCAGGIGPKGLDDRCPHKLLIRKVVDQAPATTPAANPEPFISDMSTYLTRPLGLDLASMSSETGLQTVSVVARDLLTFSVDNQTDIACEFRVTLQACNFLEAGRTTAIGSAPLSKDRHTLTISVSVFPKN